MKIPYQFTPSLIAARSKAEKEHAPNLIDLKLERSGNKGLLSATNGRMAIVVEVNELAAEDVDGMLPAEAIAAAEEGAHFDDDLPFCPLITAGVEDVVVELEPKAGRRTMIAKRTAVDLFPDVTKVVEIARRAPVVATVAFNVKYLARLAKALGCESVTFRLRDTDGKSAIEVVPFVRDAEKVSAMLMPMRRDEDEPAAAESA